MLKYTATIELHAISEEFLAFKVNSLRNVVKGLGGKLTDEDKIRTKLKRKTAEDMAPETVKLVRELYKTGLYSYRAIAEEMKRRGIPTPRGGDKWHLETVRLCLEKS